LRVDRWHQVGVDGVFFDEAGHEFRVTTARLRAAVQAVHARGLSAFLNAFNPDDLFDGQAVLDERDALLVESFAVRNGDLEPMARTAARAAAAIKWRQRFGVLVFAITTPGDGPFDAHLFASAWKSAVGFDLDGFGWGERSFSADSRLPWHPPP